MDAPDGLANGLPLLFDPAADIGEGLLLGAEGQVRVHEMARVQHDALVLVADPIKEQPGHLRLGQREARVPQVFHQQGHVPVRLGKEGIQKVGRCFRHLPAGVAVAQGEQLLVGAVGHVEDHVLSPLGLRLFYIPAIGVHESFRRVPAVEGADGLPAAQMALAGGQIAGVEIVPIGKEDQVDAQDLLRGHHAASVLAAVHELHPVEARKGRQQVRPVPIAVQVLAVGGEIEGALHGSTRSRRTISLSSRPSGPQAASQRNPWQFFRCQL